MVGLACHWAKKKNLGDSPVSFVFEIWNTFATEKPWLITDPVAPSLRAPLHQAPKKGALVGSSSAHSFLNAISSGRFFERQMNLNKRCFSTCFLGHFLGEKNTEKEWLVAREDENETSSQLRSKTKKTQCFGIPFWVWFRSAKCCTNLQDITREVLALPPKKQPPEKVPPLCCEQWAMGNLRSWSLLRRWKAKC